MTIQQNISLSNFTSLHVGGPAEHLVICDTTAEAMQFFAQPSPAPLWRLGFGCNALVSDQGLPGTTLLLRGGAITQEGDDLLIADAGVWWDELVEHAILHNAWGLELMSGIPGNVGAGVVGNIAAYGQAVADTLAWAEVMDGTGLIRKLTPAQLGFSYRMSALQTSDHTNTTVLRAAFRLSTTATQEVTYQSALDVAGSHGFDLSTLAGRRQAIMGAREQAGSLWSYHNRDYTDKTAGSFFRNPLVTPEQAEKIIAFDETKKTAELIRKMNLVHGGTSQRVSAAHVLLAAGFQRGQAWGNVRLHPQHVLKIENTGNATAQEIYIVAQEIIATVQRKLGITLQPEVKFLGQF